MTRFGKRGLALMALTAVFVLAACAHPALNAQPIHDDTQNVDRPDRGMTRSGSM